MTSELSITNTSGVNIKSYMTVSGAPFTVLQTGTGIRHFTVTGNLTLSDIILSGGTTPNPTYGGGGVIINNGHLTVESGTVIQNCYNSYYGGGVYAAEGTFEMTGGEIIGNTAKTGGVYLASNSTFKMTAGKINSNTAISYSGGIEVHHSAFEAASFSAAILLHRCITI